MLYLHKDVPLTAQTKQNLLRRTQGRLFSDLSELPSFSFLALSPALSEQDLKKYEKIISHFVFFGDNSTTDIFEKHFDAGCADFLIPPYDEAYMEKRLVKLIDMVQNLNHQSLIDEINARIGPILTQKQEILLRCLVRGSDNGVERVQLRKSCWGHDNINDKTLDVHLFNLRRQLEEARIRIIYSNSRWFLVLPTDFGR